MKHRSLSALLLLTLLLPATSWAQSSIKLQQADRVAAKQEGATVDCVKGNVIFIHGTTTIHCDSAYFNKKENSLEAFGNVRLQLAGDVLTGRRLRYNGNTRKADLQPVSGGSRPDDN